MEKLFILGVRYTVREEDYTCCPTETCFGGGREPEVPRFGAGGQGRRLQEIAPDGTLIWDYVSATDTNLLHHDVAVLPNGNIPAIAYEHVFAERSSTLGRKPDQIPEQGLWTDVIFELEPIRPDGAEIVWQWHMLDHVVQDFDPGLPSYGQIAEHPELVDINIGGLIQQGTQADLDKRRAENRLPPNASLRNVGSDLMYSNAINYIANLDQIVISSHNFSEIWILDQSLLQSRRLATMEVAGVEVEIFSIDGVIRPYMVRGADADQKLHHQHDVKWIPNGFKGAGRLIVFNNQVPSENGPYSQVSEIDPPQDDLGHDVIEDGKPFGPTEPVRVYTAADTISFYTGFISGAQRLSNGHTLVTSGPHGRFFEIDEEHNTVWEYWSPYSGEVRLPDGSFP
ncbi:MAG: hypothetical protein HKN87_20610 [Saprospiraceae bacterium]|nr:hypothetical protein [Saprospiraceae bacterium]